MKRLFATICALLSAFLFLLTAQPKLEIIPSKHLGCNDTLAVYTPAGTPSSADVPTLILLHGYSGCWSDWGRHMDLQALCNRCGWRIICPDGFYSSWYIDDANPEKMQWRRFFWEECYPLLKERYVMNPDKTFITGLSMGGHGAMNIFLDHPELFRGAGSMSGVLDVRYSSGSKEMIAAMLGRKSIEKCDDQSAVHRLERLCELGPAAVQSKVVVVTCGREDNTFYPASRLFDAKCRELGVRCISMYSPGKHSWDYWTYILPYHIDWFSQAL